MYKSIKRWEQKYSSEVIPQMPLRVFYVKLHKTMYSSLKHNVGHLSSRGLRRCISAIKYR